MDSKQPGPKEDVFRSAITPSPLTSSVLLGLIATLLAFWASSFLSPHLIEWRSENIWFEADPARVYQSMTDLGANHYRAAVHPLYLPLTLPVVKLLQAATGLEGLPAVRWILALVAGGWSILFHALLRRQGNSLGVSCLWSGLAWASAACLYWFSMPETYGLGSVTLLLPFLMLVSAPAARPRPFAVGIAAVLAFGVTVTNGMSAIVVAVMTLPRRLAVGISLAAVLVVLGSLYVTRVVAPGTTTPRLLVTERKFLRSLSPGDAWDASRTFLIRGVVAAAPSIIRNRAPGAAGSLDALSVQQAPAARGPLDSVAVVLWLGLLFLGARGALNAVRKGDRFALGLLILTAAQGILHLLYGEETFLYALHYTPLLILVASYSRETRFHRHSLIAAALLVPLLWVVNVPLWLDTVRWFNTH